MPRLHQLSAAQLHAVLSKRGRVPDTLHSHAYYVEECRKRGLFEISQYELDKATAAPSQGPLMVDLAVHELSLLPGAIRQQPFRLLIRVEPAGLRDAPLETPAVTPPYSGAARIDWSHSLPVASGGKTWEALRQALDGPPQKADVRFLLCDAANPRGASLGEAFVNLQQLLRENEDAERRQLHLLDMRKARVGSLVVRVRALDALRAVDAASTIAPDTASIPTSTLTTQQLITLLEQRGISLPRATQSHAYYVELCRTNGFTDLSPDEARLASLAPHDAPARATRAAPVATSGSAAPPPPAAIELHIDEIQMRPAASAARVASLRVDVHGLETRVLRTPSIVPPYGNSRSLVSWSHTAHLERGGADWARLARGLAEAASTSPDLTLTLLDATTRAPLGEAKYSLRRLLTAGVERSTEKARDLDVTDPHGKPVAVLFVRVRALEAMRAIEADARAAGGRTPVEQLDAEQLEKVHHGFHAPPLLYASLTHRTTTNTLFLPLTSQLLRARQVRLPSSATPYSHHFLLEECRAAGIHDVDAAEAAGLVVAPPAQHLSLRLIDLTLTPRAVRSIRPRSVRVRTDFLGLPEPHEILETAAVVPPSDGGRMRLDWAYDLPLRPGSRAWAELRPPGNDMTRRLMLFVEEAASGAPLGDAFLSLEPLRHAAAERPLQTLQVLDREQNKIGEITVEMLALDAVNAVLREPSPTNSAGTPSKDRRRPPGIDAPQQSETEEAHQLFTVTIPSDARPGELVVVEVDGQRYEVQPPEGLGANDSFEVHLPTPSDSAPPTPSADPSRPRRRRLVPVGGGADELSSSCGDLSPQRRAQQRNKQPSEAERNRAKVKLYSEKLRKEQQTKIEEARLRQQQVRQRDRPPSAGSELDQAHAAAAIQRRSDSSSLPPPAPQPPPTRSRSRVEPSIQSERTRDAEAYEARAAARPPDEGRTAPTEMEHALLVAFERLGEANAQLNSQQAVRTKLEAQLHAAQQQIGSLQKELREVQLELAEAKKLLRGGGGGGGDGARPEGSARPASSEAARGYSEQQRRRLQKLYQLKADEALTLQRRLMEAGERTEAEMRARLQAEKQSYETRRRLAEIQASLDQERRHNAAIAQERELLIEELKNLKFDYTEQAIVLEAERQMRLAQEPVKEVPSPKKARPAATATAPSCSSPPPSVKADDCDAPAPQAAPAPRRRRFEADDMSGADAHLQSAAGRQDTEANDVAAPDDSPTKSRLPIRSCSPERTAKAAKAAGCKSLGASLSSVRSAGGCSLGASMSSARSSITSHRLGASLEEFSVEPLRDSLSSSLKLPLQTGQDKMLAIRMRNMAEELSNALLQQERLYKKQHAASRHHSESVTTRAASTFSTREPSIPTHDYKAPRMAAQPSCASRDDRHTDASTPRATPTVCAKDISITTHDSSAPPVKALPSRTSRESGEAATPRAAPTISSRETSIATHDPKEPPMTAQPSHTGAATPRAAPTISSREASITTHDSTATTRAQLSCVSRDGDAK
ncbi:hypothetical protein AB1Y20_005260 [Prymnesium parvum]|uniref:Uncharacterized protein n=1 Tax=Prymnesium parvum TaxID=97485 RepID=A0AB34J3T4_PRYPA